MSPVLIWKQEPVSPSSEYDETAHLDVTIYNATPFNELDIKLDTDFESLATFESKAEAASHILENLENLMDLDELIKEEPFLLDEKILPILDEVEPPRAVPIPVQNLKTELSNANDTQYLLKEFENVYEVLDFSHVTLTPPQSPPSQPTLTTLEPLLQYQIVPETTKLVYQQPEKQFLSENFTQINYPITLNTPQPDIARELAVVDELVRSRVEDMQWSSSGSSGPGSPGSSSCSNFGDCSSDDPEWVPEPIEQYNEDGPLKPSRKRTKPYSKHAPEEKRVRKKEQNKNAATRYRLKKKAEIEVILHEEKGLLDKKSELEVKVTDLNREIKYLKGLMRDLFKAKGLIN
ncbi:activating transcription factor of chaperone [Diorhabda sublineata]|uniref:activating transcription factor of chaperone n=1 Tax=Diorhabda sublineata TaxID=1163346 RepID=UPI0024E14D7A|nr:activating transcription factor of chaperone [Diorhabda sublineata]